MSYLYSCLAGTPRNQITPEKIDKFLALVNDDQRVKVIQKTKNPIEFYIEAVELENGVYSFGRICNHLNELPSAIKARLEADILPDLINIKNFMQYGFREDHEIRSLPKHTLACLREAVRTCKSSLEKAQLINTLTFKLNGNESIADRLLRDHVSIGHAKRHAALLLQAGCANEINRRKGLYGTFVFEDGSEL